MEKSCKVGILGGGQLAQMLAQAARDMGLTCAVWTQSKKFGAALVADQVWESDYSNTQKLAEFLQSCERVIFESEFVPVDLLTLAAGQASGETQFVPPLTCISRLRDKLEQKRMLQQLGIPTSEFTTEIEGWLSGRDGKIVLKWAGWGYDGKGVLVVPLPLQGEMRLQVDRFLELARGKGVQVYAERFVPFVAELAVIGCRGEKGEWVHYPVVYSEQVHGICDVVKGPATRLGLPQTAAEEVVKAARKIAEATNLVGSFGVEFFLLSDGSILVNEVAPRVHNSGHYSQLAGTVSQFGNHLRCVTGLAPIDPKTDGFFGMVNLVGPEGVVREQALSDLPVVPAGLQLQWYDKGEVRRGRKVGHLNFIADGLSDWKAKYQLALAWREKWKEELL